MDPNKYTLFSLHKKAARFIQQGNLKAYQNLTRLLNLPSLKSTYEFLSDRYHYHLHQAKVTKKEHNLLYLHQVDRPTSIAPLPCFIYLDRLRSAHNVGSIVRSLEAFRLGTLLADPSTPSIQHPKVCKTSMNAHRYVQWQTIEKEEEIPRPWIALETIPTAPIYSDFSFPNTFSLLLGNEESGLKETLLQKADDVIQVPLVGYKNSLNVACAFTIVAAEIHRQLRA